MILMKGLLFLIDLGFEFANDFQNFQQHFQYKRRFKVLPGLMALSKYNDVCRDG